MKIPPQSEYTGPSPDGVGHYCTPILGGPTGRDYWRWGDTGLKCDPCVDLLYPKVLRPSFCPVEPPWPPPEPPQPPPIPPEPPPKEEPPVQQVAEFDSSLIPQATPVTVTSKPGEWFRGLSPWIVVVAGVLLVFFLKGKH